jgi:hypothetical protein
MNKLLLILFTFSFPFFLFSQGSYTQTSTIDFNNNVNYMINTSNDEMKIAYNLGTGADGDINISGTLTTDNVRTKVAGINLSGQNTINVYSSTGFSVNDEILIITSQDANTNLSQNLTGQYEFKRITSISANTLYLSSNLFFTYDTTGRKHQVLRVPNYNNVILSGTITCNAWDGNTGGIICFRVKGTLSMNGGTINAAYLGYRSGPIYLGSSGIQGEGITGLGIMDHSANANGGGGGQRAIYNNNYHGAGGGGGGNPFEGLNGTGRGYDPPSEGIGGIGLGNANSRLFLGGAGGHGGNYFTPYIGGGNGGGIIYIACDSISFQSGIISSPGQPGSLCQIANDSITGEGGGGAGGTIIFISRKNVILPYWGIMAIAGCRTSHGGYWPGGYGSIGKIQICAPSITGYTNPNYTMFSGNVEMYFLDASSITPVITKSAINGWGTLTYNCDTSLSGTHVKIDILTANNELIVGNIPSGTDLSATISPFTSSIKLKCILTNSDLFQTPRLYDWTVTWVLSTVTTTPILLLPTNNSTNVSLTPLLDCSEVANATNYKYQIALDSSFNILLFDSSISVSQINVPAGILNYNLTYYWRACGFNNTGFGPWSIIFNFTTISQIPNAPTLILPANGATGQPTTITFKWYKAVETLLGSFIKKEKKNKSKNETDEPLTISKYWFEYGTDSTLSTVIARDSSLSDTTKTISGLSNITKYYWRVKAKNQTGWGNFSSIWNFTTIIPIPTAPMLISPANGSIDISLTPALDWGDVAYAISYRLQISIDSLFGTTAFDSSGLSVSNISIPSGKLATLKKYYWRVNATNVAGTGVWSTVWNFTTIPNAPNAPVLVSPPNGSTGQPINMTFVWRKAVETLVTMSKAPKNNINQIPFNDDVLTLSKYWLEYTSTDSTFSTGVNRDSSATDTAKSVTLSYNTKYWWRVKAKNQTGWGSFSAVWSFTTILPVPIAPTLLLPANNATGVSLTPLLDWSDVASAASYRIQISSDSIFAVTAFDTTGVTVSQLTVPAGKLTGLTKYYWRVNATNAVGTGPWSTIWNFRTLQILTLNLKVYLEGFWTGTTQKPDTVMVYLAGALTPHTFSDSAKVFLSPTGTALITFTKTPNASYYIVVQHRNHLQTWSAFAQVFITNIMVNYDFTTADSQAYGNNMKQVESVWVLIVGDENQDGSIDAVDVSDLIIQYGNIGYLSCDFNCDGSVDAADVPYMIDNYGLTKVVPTLLLEPVGTRKQKQKMLQEKPNNFLKENKINKINSN